MATYTAGSLSANGARTPGVSATDFHTRRLFDFSDRVAELAPDESPFFVYLSKVAKVPTSDSQFRFLEDRTKISITDRAFLLKGAQTIAAEVIQIFYLILLVELQLTGYYQVWL